MSAAGDMRSKPGMLPLQAVRNRRKSVDSRVTARSSQLSHGPNSAQAALRGLIVQRLPVQWRYGRRWQLLQAVYYSGAFGMMGLLAYVMWFRDDEKTIAARAAQYTYVRNDRGEVVDVTKKVLMDEALRARHRSARYTKDEADW